MNRIVDPLPSQSCFPLTMLIIVTGLVVSGWTNRGHFRMNTRVVKNDESIVSKRIFVFGFVETLSTVSEKENSTYILSSVWTRDPVGLDELLY